MKKKFYVVWSGLNPGIYHSWDDCQAQIKGVKGAVYKSFDSKEEAERAYASPAYEYVKRSPSKSSQARLLGGDKSPFAATDAPSASALKMLHFQEELEQQCWLQGYRRQTAPAQRMVDFTRKKLSYDLPFSSYSPGLISSPLHFWMPEFISSRLQRGFEQFGRTSHGFLTNEATVIGVETRTSAPIRIIRDRETLQHISINGLFPCGEGAGYAGGIVSAAIDGERCAEVAAAYVKQ